VVIGSTASLHEQVRAALAQEIQDGRYDDSGRIPSEPELCERFGVSRITVRRAVSDLEELGIVRRRQGAGTFITKRSDVLGTMAIGGFADQISEGGEKSRAIMRAVTTAADPARASALGIATGSPVFVLERVFRIDGLPLALDRSVYSLERYPGFAERISDDTSTYRVLREEYGVHFAEVRREVRLGYTTAQTAEWLQRPEHEPLIVIEKVALDRDGAVIHTSHIESVPSRVTLRTVAYEEHPA
jgi:GntR family frlABCD operon transcriptional regulator